MKHLPRVFWLFVLAAVFAGRNAYSAEPTNSASASDPYANESLTQRDARMKWWREARFGMFIHWGVYSVPAGIYKGHEVTGIGEWIMNHGKIPVAEYRDYASRFNPAKFDADAWVRLARDAGMKYIVITSKHHDGFAMFDSKASDWNIVKATPFKRDPLKELAAACRKYGIKLGFYYSQAQDWNNGGSAAGGKWDPAQEHDMDDYIDKVAVAQMKEILTHYGEFPAVLWWDTPVNMNQERAAKLIAALKLKPGIIHNNRLGGGFRGDTETPEQFIPPTGYPGRDWETCMTMNDTWGFKTNDHNWKSTQTLIRNLVDIASKGGNYLLNVGPTSEGLIPEPSVERLQQIGEWMKVNHEAIYATKASPFKRLPWGRCTRSQDGTTFYLHVFHWPADGKLIVPGLTAVPSQARLLAAASKKLSSKMLEQGLELEVPATAPDKVSSTVVLEFAKEPEVQNLGLFQDFDGSLLLQAGEATLHGEQLQYESAPPHDNIGFWNNPDDWAEWTFTVSKPGKFTVSAELATTEKTSFELRVGEQQLRAEANPTGDWTRFRTVRVGTVELASPGKATLSLHAVKDGWQPLNVKSVRLKPLAQKP